jgi:hypothetical protein
MEGLSRAFFKLHNMREYPDLEMSWSTQGLILLGKIQEQGQFAGNQLKQVSSETSNEAEIDITFKQWLIGFTEGDGSFIINKNNYLEFKITQSSNDAQILFYIKKELGFGSVSVQDKKNKTHHYRVRNKEGILKLIEIFNGNLCTERKNNQFKLWLEAFNKAYKTNIVLIENKNYPSLEDSWLNGFTDAEGCFTISIINRSETYNQVQVRYIISQKGELDLMNKIAELLNGKVHYIKSYDGNNMVVNITKLKKIIKYLNKYRLKTKKYIDYLNWIKVYKLVIAKEHYNKEKLEKIKKIMSKINK